jgi:hypothetical protein
MHNAINSMGASPIDLLLGFGDQRSARGPTGGEGFAALLGLFPQSRPMLGIPMGVQGPLGLSDLGGAPMNATATGQADVALTPQLVELLGLQPQLLTAMSATPASTLPMESEPVPVATADLLATDDGINQTLYLTIPRDQAAMIGAPAVPMAGDTQNEAAFSLRLWTVEQHGDRVSADAELQTATGKAVPVRLSLELTGNPITNQPSLPLSAGGDMAPMDDSMQARQLNLPRLLSELGAHKLVIEEMNPESAFRTPMTAMDPMPAPLKGQESRIRDAAFSRNGSVMPAGVGGRETMMRITTAMPTENISKQSIVENNARFTLPELLIDQVDAGADDPVAAGVKAEPVAPGGTGTTVSEAGISSLPDLPATKPGTVRFFDLDFKLEQLKQQPGQKIRIQLVPSHLGKMELSVINHRGLVTVNLQLDSAEARQAVQRNLPQLERQLASAGIKVDSFQLHVAQPAKGAAVWSQYHPLRHESLGGQSGQGYSQHPHDRRQPARYAPTAANFAQTMVDCLA